MANLFFGLLLVGCASPQKGKSFASYNPFKKKEPPIEVLKNTRETDPRIAAYRKLRDPKAAGADRQMAVDLLAAGARNEKNELARSAAVISLGSYNEPTVLPALELACHDPSDMVRGDVCRSLAKVDSPDAVAILGRMAVNDPSLDVRLAALDGLTQKKDPGASNYLLACLRDRDVAIAQTARAGLKKTYQIDLGGDQVAWSQYIRDHGGSAEPVQLPAKGDDKQAKEKASRLAAKSAIDDMFR